MLKLRVLLKYYVFGGEVYIEMLGYKVKFSTLAFPKYIFMPSYLRAHCA